jgi:hypothetical protein
MTAQINTDIVKVNEGFVVTMYDNGFVVDYSGTDVSENHVHAKTVVIGAEDLNTLIQELFALPRNK